MSKDQTKATVLDKLKLLFAFLLILVGTAVVSQSKMFDQIKYSGLVKTVAILGIVGLGIFIAYLSVQGKRAWGFIQEARVELRKVTWPTRQEAVQMTLIVIVMVFIVGIIIWVFDSVLAAFVRRFTDT